MRFLVALLLLAFPGPSQVSDPVQRTDRSPSEAPPPNVVLIISDDQAYGDYGFMGSEAIETPHLDRLAAEGLTFPRGYVPTALCRPSLMTLATGLYPHQHKITGNDPPRGIDRQRMLAHIDALDTLPEILGRSGYRSMQTGKWWEGNFARGGFDEGMTHGDPKRRGRHGDVGLQIGRKSMRPALDFIDRCSAQKTPFFLWYAPFLPHTPHNPPERLLAKYRRDGVPGPIAKYRAMCTWFDETCGTLLGHLEQQKLTDNTLVVLVTDNGWIQRPNARGFAPRSKRSPYEGGVRTPIVLRWPASIPPGRRDFPVSSVDIPSTILAACGIDKPEAWPGVDLRTTTAAQRGAVCGAEFTHNAVDIHRPRQNALSRWVIRDPHKCIVPTKPGREPELFDLRQDPGELQPIQDAALQRELQKEIDGWWPTSSVSPPDGIRRAGDAKRPNLLFVLTDDQRFDQLSCAGHPVLVTPTIDSLAQRGVRFTNAFVTTSICAASRATFLTGRREGRHNYTFGQPPMGPDIGSETYLAKLHEAGYRTGFVGKWGVKFAKGALGDALDYRRLPSYPILRKRDGQTSHLTHRVEAAAVEFLRQQGARTAGAPQPFCLSVSFHAPHAQDNHPDQYIPPPELAKAYVDREVPVPPLATKGFEVLPDFLQTSLGRVRWAWRFDDRAKQVRRTRDYWRMITGIDRSLGRILATLEQQGLADNTVVVFTSDNGYFLGERGLAGKWLIYEESIRVPMIVFDPRAPQSRRGVLADQMVLNLDVAPTLLDLAGVEAPESYEGRSLAPLLNGHSVDWRTDFLYEHRMRHAKIPKSEGVRGDRWVYARYYDQQPVYEQLFDLHADPQQLNNLALDAAHAETLGQQRARCEALLAR